MMANVKNKFKPGQGKVPVAVGYGLDTEIWDKSQGNGGAWVAYEPIQDRNWYSLGCLVEHNDKIYSIRDDVTELDWKTWQANSLKTSDIKIS